MSNKCGLYNLGNTCYMNSIIQILYNTTEFYDFIGNYKGSPRNEVVVNFFDLIKEMSQSKESISPDQFLTNFQNYSEKNGLNNFTGFAQNDSSEFLIILMDMIYESI